MFKKIVKNKFNKCNTKEEYIQIRNELKEFGVENFYLEMENVGIFKDGYINHQNNPFAKMVLGINREYVEIGFKDEDECNFICINSPPYENQKHKFISPKILEWDTFNILTLSEKDIPMLLNMKELATSYVQVMEYDNFSFAFHCYPFNTVHTLHLHIVDLDSEPSFANKTNNLSIDDVLEVLQENY